MLSAFAAILVIPVSLGWWVSTTLVDASGFSETLSEAFDPQVLVVPITTVVTDEVVERTGIPPEVARNVVTQVITPEYVDTQLQPLIAGLHAVLFEGAEPSSVGIDLLPIKNGIGSIATTAGVTLPPEVVAAVANLPDRLTLGELGLPEGSLPDVSAATRVSRGVIAGLGVLLLGLLLLSILVAPRKAAQVRRAAMMVAVPSIVLLAMVWFGQVMLTDTLDRALRNAITGSASDVVLGLLGGVLGSLVRQEIVISAVALGVAIAAWAAEAATRADRTYDPSRQFAGPPSAQVPIIVPPYQGYAQPVAPPGYVQPVPAPGYVPHAPPAYGPAAYPTAGYGAAPPGWTAPVPGGDEEQWPPEP